MRQVKIFSGSSHPALTETICERLGTLPAKCELRKFSNGETSVSIGEALFSIDEIIALVRISLLISLDCSIRDQNVFVVQSGSNKVNDNIMELLIMIAACKGGSAKKITGELWFWPFRMQGKLTPWI
jgi:ribose-phosphate pyrophosphokinase